MITDEGIQTLLKIVGSALGIAILGVTVRFIGDWGSRGETIDTTAKGVEKLGDKFDKFAEKNGTEHQQLFIEAAMQKDILIGPQGVGGVREAVEEIKQSAFKKNDEDHARWGNLGLWQLETDGQLQRINDHLGFDTEKRTGPVDRRKPRKGGLRKGDVQ